MLGAQVVDLYRELTEYSEVVAWHFSSVTATVTTVYHVRLDQRGIYNLEIEATLSVNFEDLFSSQPRPTTSPAQLAAARAAARQAGAGSAAIRYRFVAREDGSPHSTPMARILRGDGGRGGATRLKLYLSLLWLARSFSRDRPVFAYPAQQLAVLLGLPNPEAAGARRIQEALRWLEKADFVTLDRRRGDVTRVHLLDDAGSGKPYRPTGPLVRRAARRTQDDREPHFYVQLDARFWTEGWISDLSGPAVAMYLACLYEQRGRPYEPVWISPRVGRERFDLSDETRNKGLRELVDAGLLDMQRRPVPATSLFDERFRARNVYLVRHDRWVRAPEASPKETSELDLNRLLETNWE
jgi:hypothetical protein